MENQKLPCTWHLKCISLFCSFYFLTNHDLKENWKQITYIDDAYFRRKCNASLLKFIAFSLLNMAMSYHIYEYTLVKISTEKKRICKLKSTSIAQWKSLVFINGFFTLDMLLDLCYSWHFRWTAINKMFPNQLKCIITSEMSVNETSSCMILSVMQK